MWTQNNKLWSLQFWMQFLQLRMEAWIFQDFKGVWTHDFTIVVRLEFCHSLSSVFLRDERGLISRNSGNRAYIVVWCSNQLTSWQHHLEKAMFCKLASSVLYSHNYSWKTEDLLQENREHNFKGSYASVMFWPKMMILHPSNSFVNQEKELRKRVGEGYRPHLLELNNTSWPPTEFKKA